MGQRNARRAAGRRPLLAAFGAEDEDDKPRRVLKPIQYTEEELRAMQARPIAAGSAGSDGRKRRLWTQRNQRVLWRRAVGAAHTWGRTVAISAAQSGGARPCTPAIVLAQKHCPRRSAVGRSGQRTERPGRAATEAALQSAHATPAQLWPGAGAPPGRVPTAPTRRVARRQAREAERAKPSPEDAAAALKELIRSIPTDQEAVFAYAVKWAAFDAAAATLVPKLSGWVGKKIAELLGVEEPTMVRPPLGAAGARPLAPTACPGARLSGARACMRPRRRARRPACPLCSAAPRRWAPSGSGAHMQAGTRHRRIYGLVLAAWSCRPAAASAAPARCARAGRRDKSCAAPADAHASPRRWTSSSAS